jgi:hypothetical protein
MLEALRKSEEGERGMNRLCVPRKLDRTGATLHATGRAAARPSLCDLIINLQYPEDGANGQREAVTSSTKKHQESCESRTPKADDRTSAEVYAHRAWKTGREDAPSG